MCWVVPTAQICFNEPRFLVGEVLCFVMNQVFTPRRIVGVKG